MKPEIGALLSGYAADTLTSDEQARLVEAALEDQEVFDALAAEQSLREVLSDPAVRRELQAALERPKPMWLAWARPYWPALAAATAAVLAVLWLRPPEPVPTPAPSATPWTTVGRPGDSPSRSAVLDGLLALRSGGPVLADLHLDRPRYRVGEPIGIRFEVTHEANVLVLIRAADGRVTEAFPGTTTAFPRVKSGASHAVDETVPGPPGELLVRLIAFPVGTDPLTISLDELRLVTPRLTVIDEQVEVTP